MSSAVRRLISASMAAYAFGDGSLSGERAGKPQLRLVFGTGAAPESTEQNPDEPVAEHRGINIHAKQSVDGRDRRQLERLCRYVTRPPSLRKGSSGVIGLEHDPRAASA